MVEAVVGGEEASRDCPNCHSRKNWKDGTRETGFGSVQRFVCRDCGFRFSDKSNIESQTTRGHQACVILQDAKNLDAQANIETVCAGDTNLVNYAWLQKKRGNADTTINLRVSVLKLMQKKGANLANPETVDTLLAVEPLTKSRKYVWKQAYRSYTKTMKIPWEPPRVNYEPKQPFMPTHEELTALIYAANKQLATFLQVALTTGARCGEICKLKWTDINTEQCTISINEAEKGSRNRTIKVPEKTTSMINALRQNHGQYLFNQNPETHKANLLNLVKRLANTQKNPRFKQIHLHTFRHYFATEKLRQTKMLTHVQYLLGHKSIVNTERYTHLVDFSGDRYFSAVATTRKEKQILIEEGFEYVSCDPDGLNISGSQSNRKNSLI